MLLFTNALPTFFFFPSTFGCLSPYVFPSIVLVSNSKCGWKSCKFLPLNHTAATDRRCVHLASKGMFYGCSGIVRRCKGLDSEGDFALEADILEFMKGSNNPEAFPSKKDLIEAGREDLVDAIVKEGGWLCLGWNLDEEEDAGVGQYSLEDQESIVATDWDSFGESNSSKRDERQRFAAAASISSASTSSSFTGRSLEIVAEHESGIEGMLSRLEKERNVTFRVGFPGAVGDLHPETTAKETVADLQGRTISTPLSAKESKWNDLGGNLSQSSSPVQINGLGGFVSPGDFEASEIALRKGRNEEALDVLRNETLGSGGDPIKSNSDEEEMNHNQIRRHLQNLELELSSIVCSLRSNALEKGQSRSSDDLLELSDACEFQENEILNAKDKLRSLRAKLAVVEGKMALTIIDAQKTIEEKQKRINCNRRALQILRAACVVWPNSASEVLLVGSFDGWSTQRKMEKSSTGVFSLFLRLYPGTYEIKFIVDGQWKIDPLRPIINSSGFENNLLIIT